jgi:hypothetical protein
MKSKNNPHAHQFRPNSTCAAVREEPSHFRTAAFLFLSVASGKTARLKPIASLEIPGVITNKHSPLPFREFSEIFEIRRNFTRCCVQIYLQTLYIVLPFKIPPEIIDKGV